MGKALKLIADHAGAEFGLDAWGVAVNLAFDICEVLDAIPSPIPAEWEYQRGASSVPSLESLAHDGESLFGAAGLAQAVLDGEVTADDLLYVGRVMDRYAALLDAAGKSY